MKFEFFLVSFFFFCYDANVDTMNSIHCWWTKLQCYWFWCDSERKKPWSETFNESMRTKERKYNFETRIRSEVSLHSMVKHPKKFYRFYDKNSFYRSSLSTIMWLIAEQRRQMVTVTTVYREIFHLRFETGQIAWCNNRRQCEAIHSRSSNSKGNLNLSSSKVILILWLSRNLCISYHSFVFFLFSNVSV